MNEDKKCFMFKAFKLVENERKIEKSGRIVKTPQNLRNKVSTVFSNSKRFESLLKILDFEL